MTQRCSHAGCQRRATHAPVILIPAVGWPREEHRALRIVGGIPCCRTHAERFDPFSILDQPAPGDPTQTFAELVPPALARMAGSDLAPDCDRAWVIAIRTDSDEYHAFEASLRPPEGTCHGEA